MATMMTLPTDDDVKQHGHADAGAMLLDLSARGEKVRPRAHDSREPHIASSAPESAPPPSPPPPHTQPHAREKGGQ